MNIYADELEIDGRLRVHHPNFGGQNFGFFPDHIMSPAEDKPPPQELLDQHRTAQFILTQKDRPIPSIEEMKAAISQPETVEFLKEQIDALEEQHAADLERMYALEAEEYLDEAHDRYLSKDDLLYLAEGENNPELKESYDQLKNLYENGRYEVYTLGRWAHDYELLRYTHLRAVTSLQKRIRIIENEQLEAQRRREKDFPQSIEDFYSKAEDIQRNVIALLTSHTEGEKDNIMSRFGWSSRQCASLLTLYKTNKKFQGDIVTMKITLDMKMTTSDPRRR